MSRCSAIIRPIRDAAAHALLILLSADVVLAQAPPSADTMMVSSRPSQNFGSIHIVMVQIGVTSLIQFNLAGVPTNATLRSASLRLSGTTRNAGGGGIVRISAESGAGDKLPAHHPQEHFQRPEQVYVSVHGRNGNQDVSCGGCALRQRPLRRLLHREDAAQVNGHRDYTRSDELALI